MIFVGLSISQDERVYEYRVRAVIRALCDVCEESTRTLACVWCIVQINMSIVT